MLLNARRAKLTHLAGVLPGHTHRTTHGVFLSRSDWDAAGLLGAEVQHNCTSDRKRYGKLEDVPVWHEYCVVFKKVVATGGPCESADRLSSSRRFRVSGARTNDTGVMTYEP